MHRLAISPQEVKHSFPLLRLRNLTKRHYSTSKELKSVMADWKPWLEAAEEQAELSSSQGGHPVGSVLVNDKGEIVSRGHNENAQSKDPTAHAEVVCLRNAGHRQDWGSCTLVTTLSPCIMCSGTIAYFKIPRVIVGETTNFCDKQALEMLKARGTEIVFADECRCSGLLQKFISENPEIWRGVQKSLQKK